MQGYHYPCFNVTSPIPDVCLVLVQSDRKLNTFTEAMRHDFRRLITRLSDDSQVRAIVIAGAGDHFTAGLDLQEAMKGPILSGVDRTIDPARKARINREYILDFQASVDVVERCAKPVITALHGLSYGLAIDLACCADMRICAANTRFCVKEIDVGIAADLGTLSRLPRVVGNASFVRDVCLTGREFSAQEAAQVGFVSYVEETRERAIDQAVEIAGQIAQKSPVAIQGTKDILNHARDHPVGESLRYTAVWNGAALQTQDVKEAMLSFRLRKMPTFEKL